MDEMLIKTVVMYPMLINCQIPHDYHPVDRVHKMQPLYVITLASVVSNPPHTVNQMSWMIMNFLYVEYSAD